MSHGKRPHHKAHHAGPAARSSAYVPGNRIALLRNGDAYFPAIEAAFDRARHEIYLESYIYEQDAVGQRIADALLRAVLRGVNTYVLIDGYGSKDLPRGMVDRLRSGGVRVLIYRPRISPWTCKRKRLRRMHRKIVVVDREIAFVGGINIIEDNEPSVGLFPRFDYAVSVEGPLVDTIRRSVRHLWSMVAWSYFREGTVRGVPPPAPDFIGGRMNAAFLVRDNFRHRRDIEAAYIGAIDQAGSEIILASAYFLPGLHFRHALINAAARGVRVVLLLQGRIEYVLQHYASRALYGSLLDAGIEIFEYRTSFLHAKVAVIDGHWSTVGSSNIDPFSLLLSREANVVIDDGEFGATLAHSLKQTIEADGRRISNDNWKQQPAYFRFLSWISYGIVRFMTGIAGEGSRTIDDRAPSPED